MQNPINDPFRLGYALGLVVGEGSFCDDGKVPMLCVKLIEREPLVELALMFGGRIHGPYQPKPPRQPYWNWLLRSRPLRQSLHVFHQWLPPSRRRAQFERWAKRWSGFLDSDGSYARRQADGSLVRFEGPGAYPGEKVGRPLRKLPRTAGIVAP